MAATKPDTALRPVAAKAGCYEVGQYVAVAAGLGREQTSDTALCPVAAKAGCYEVGRYVAVAAGLGRDQA